MVRFPAALSLPALAPLGPPGFDGDVIVALIVFGVALLACLVIGALPLALYFTWTGLSTTFRRRHSSTPSLVVLKGGLK